MRLTNTFRETTYLRFHERYPRFGALALQLCARKVGLPRVKHLEVRGPQVQTARAIAQREFPIRVMSS
jgi:hypothetical protein